jgi:quercetin dioxygenase-like cupin family protein
MAELIGYQEGSVVSRQLVKGGGGNVTLFAFDKDEGLTEHASPFDALVYVLDGEAEVAIAGRPSRLHAGDMIVMPAKEPHALKAPSRFKMLLVMIKP